MSYPVCDRCGRARCGCTSVTLRRRWMRVRYRRGRLVRPVTVHDVLELSLRQSIVIRLLWPDDSLDPNCPSVIPSKHTTQGDTTP